MSNLLRENESIFQFIWLPVCFSTSHMMNVFILAVAGLVLIVVVYVPPLLYISDHISQKSIVPTCWERLHERWLKEYEIWPFLLFASQ